MDSANALLAMSDADNSIQAFKLVQGQINKGTGSTFNASFIYCASDGQLQITWPNGASDVISMTEGTAFTFGLTLTIIVNSGVFHYNNK